MVPDAAREGTARPPSDDRRGRPAQETRDRRRLDPHEDATGLVRVFAEWVGSQQLELRGICGYGGGVLSVEAAPSGRIVVEDVRVGRRNESPVPRPGDQAPAEDYSPPTEAAEAVRPRFTRGSHPGVRLEQRGFRKERRQHVVRPLRFRGHAPPLRENGSVRRLEIKEQDPHLSPELFCFLTLLGDT